VLLGVIALVAAAAAFWITHGRADTDLLDRAADYWPLLLALLGLGLLPLAFQRPTR